MSTDGTDYVLGRVKEVETKISDIENVGRYQYVIGCAEIENILNYTETQLSKLTSEECDINSYQCAQYLIELQRRINKAKTIKNWSNENLSIVIAREYTNYKTDKFTPYEVVKYSVIGDNSYAKKLHEVIQEQDIIISSTYDIIKHVTMIANTFKNLSYSKKGEHVAYREN